MSLCSLARREMHGSMKGKGRPLVRGKSGVQVAKPEGCQCGVTPAYVGDSSEGQIWVDRHAVVEMLVSVPDTSAPSSLKCRW